MAVSLFPVGNFVGPGISHQVVLYSVFVCKVGFEEFNSFKVTEIVLSVVMTVCTAIGGYLRFGGTCCLILYVRGGCTVLQNFCKHILLILQSFDRLAAFHLDLLQTIFFIAV
jgi:hypothetical protein